MHDLSIVNVVSEHHVDSLNEFAEILGMGVDNLSTKLIDSSGNIYFGCHSWWTVEKYITFKDLSALLKLGINVDKYKPALKNLHEFVRDTSRMEYSEIVTTPNENWNQSLNELGLMVYIEEEI